jgi:hypothetical protein
MYVVLQINRITHLIDFKALKELIRVKDDPQDD